MTAEKKPRPPKAEAPPPPALRLRLEWRLGQWQLVKVIRLPSKALSAADLPLDEKEASPLRGVWFEAADRQDRLILRRRVIEPLPVTAEKALTYGDAFLLDLLMPAIPEIARVRLLANPDPFQPGFRGGEDRPVLLAAIEVPQAAGGKKSKEPAA